MRILSTVLYLIAALINLLPVSGVLSARRLEALYGIAVEDPNLLILLRHRAVLFGIVGGLLVAAALRRPLRQVAFIAGLVSMLSYVLIAWLVGGYNAELQRVVWVDLVGLASLVGAGLIDRFGDRAEPG